jgi:Uma2 family endonuclease
MTVEEFDLFVMLPENRNRLFEFISEKAVEVLSSPYSSMIGASAAAKSVLFVETYRLGYVTGTNGGYKISGERYIPRAAFVSQQKQVRPSLEPYNSIAPDLVVEMVFLHNIDDIRIKIANYLSAGTVVWLINLDEKRVEVYSPNRPPMMLGIGDVLDGGDVLPGFVLPVREIFPE